MTLLWEGVPTFATGQYLSAAGQLNALGKAAALLFDRVTGYSAPFTGGSNVNDGGGLHWRVRHKWDALDWEYNLVGTGTAYITCNGVKLAATERNSAGWHSGVTSLSSLSLTPNAFYELQLIFSGSGQVYVYRLAERSTYTLPTLASFANGATPTAAQWNDMAAYADYLHVETAAPRPLVGGNWAGSGRGWLGSLVKTGNRWPYQLQLQSPYHAQSDGRRYMRAILRANHPSTGDVTLGVWEQTKDNSAAGEVRTYAGVLDVTSAGFPQGDLVRVWFDIERSTAADLYGGAWFDRLWQLGDDAPTLAGWQAVPTWAHPGYATDVSKLRDDLLVVRGAYEPLNWAARVARPIHPAAAGPFTETLRARRVHRWLHYLCFAADSQPQLLWNPGAGARTAALTAATTWQVCDLAAQEGLYPGLLYSLTDVAYALEDYDA